MPRKKEQLNLDIEKIENLVADRLAEILVRQLDYQKLQAQENNKNKHGKYDGKTVYNQ